MINFEVARYSDGIIATIHDFALFEKGIPVYPITKNQLKEYRKTSSIDGIIKNGKLLVAKYNFDCPTEVLKETVSDKNSHFAKHEIEENKNIAKKVSRVTREKKEALSKNDNNLSNEEIKELMSLSSEKINAFHPTMKGFLKNQLLILRYNESKVEDYHAKLLWSFIQQNAVKGKAILGNLELSQRGLSTSVIKKAKEELIKLGLITFSQEILNSRVRNIYNIL